MGKTLSAVNPYNRPKVPPNPQPETNWIAYPIDCNRDNPDLTKRTGKPNPMIEREIRPILREDSFADMPVNGRTGSTPPDGRDPKRTGLRILLILIMISLIWRNELAGLSL